MSMAIKNLKKYELSFIVFSSLLIAFLFTVPYLSSLIYATDDPAKPFFNSGFIIRNSIWHFSLTFVSMMIFIYLNYKWVWYMIPKSTSKLIRIVLLIVYNLIAFGIILLLTTLMSYVVMYKFFGFQEKLMFYLWKYVIVQPFGILDAYVLSLIYRSKIVELDYYKLKKEHLSIQLKTLHDQINPHFLFNTLNTLSSLIRVGKKEDSLRFVENLSKVYRHILDYDGKDLVSVRTEIESLDAYIFMISKRFGKSLNIDVNLSENAMTAEIPPMALQTLLENTIKHNSLKSNTPLNVNIFDEKGFIIVKNNIIPKATQEPSSGIGLNNIIQRYAILTDKKVSITDENGHFKVSLPMLRS